MTETLNYDKKYWEKPCPQVDCRKDSCKCGLKRVFLPASLGDDGKDSPVAPKNGAYCDALVIYEANDHVYIYSKEGIPTLMASGDSGVEEEINKLKRSLGNEVADRIEGDTTLQNEIDDIKNSPDVVDIVATYADLQSYDTSKLGDNDIIRVLQDEEHDGQSTYYRWGKQSETWTYIGAVGDYYTKGQVDTLLSAKQNQLTAGSNVSIAQEGDDLVISATDTTYSNFVGTDGVTAGSAGLVPAPATADAGKFLKADGTWDTAGGGNTGEAKALTADDYNANSSNWSDTDPAHFNCVALWKLPSGMYHRSASTVTVKITRTENLGNGELAIIGKSGTYGIEEFILTDGVANNGFSYAKVRIASPLGIEVAGYGLFQTVDDLTKSYTQAPLSANQGKILNNKINAISSYSETEVNTGATWIDGKTIYKKSYSKTISGNSQTFSLGITNLYEIVKIEAIWHIGGTLTNGMPTTVAFPGDSGNANAITLFTYSGTVEIDSNGRNGTKGVITFYYTKSS